MTMEKFSFALSGHNSINFTIKDTTVTGFNSFLLNQYVLLFFSTF